MFLIPLWQRTQLEEVVLKNLCRFKENYSLDIHCIVSEIQAIRLCTQLGISYTIFENDPVGRKWNAGLLAIKDKEWENLCVIGSDDIVLEELFIQYENIHDDVAQFDGLAFYISKRDKFKNYRGYVGAGRKIKRSVIEALDYHLWDDTKSRGLDTSAELRLNDFGFTIKPYTANSPVLIDIKTDVNITTKIDSLIGYRLEKQDALNLIPPATLKELQQLYPKL